MIFGPCAHNSWTVGPLEESKISTEPPWQRLPSDDSKIWGYNISFIENSQKQFGSDFGLSEDYKISTGLSWIEEKLKALVCWRTVKKECYLFVEKPMEKNTKIMFSVSRKGYGKKDKRMVSVSRKGQGLPVSETPSS